jgi:cellulose synthase/poly-beta-1,6-N-acetylglucosamine synthase-like glycosyltransferase
MQISEYKKGKNRALHLLIAHSVSAVRQQIKQAVGELHYVKVVGEAANTAETLQQTIELQPDVVVLAEDGPDLRNGHLVRGIKAKRPKTKILIPTDGGLTRDAALGAGVDGFFDSTDGYRVLCETLHKLYARTQYPPLSPIVKPPPPMPWSNRKLWIGIGAGLGLALLACMVLLPRVAFPLIALSCGLLFFLYGLKYYLSVALILSATSGGSNGNGNGLNGVFNGLGAVNGIKKRPETQGRSSLRRIADKLLGFRLKGRGSDTHGADGNGRKGKNGIANGNGYRFKPNEQPFVSIHLPLYNESRVVGRLLEACTRLDYKNYEVLVADDSTDKTIHDLEKWAKHPKVKISHRINRTGFKGAALRHAMEVMDPRTQYIVIFDADFIPPPDVLHQFLSYFYGVNGNNGYDPGVGGELELIDESLAVVQGYQWHILNASENWITRGVRTEFSGSYVVERPGQELTGGMKMISGSVFMIRADLLREVGWGTSITEDWELTIRLYLDGYRVLYSPFIQAPAECVSDFKQLVRQRMRWAEGHTFNVKRYFFPVLSSAKLTRREKLEFIYYAPYYLQSVFFIVGTLAWLVEEIILRSRLPFWTATLGWSLVFTNTFALILMNVAGLFLERGVRRNAAGLMSFIMLTFLLVPYQAYAAMKGLLEPHEGGWHRTDKTGVITEVIDKLGLGRRMRGLMPKRKPRSIDIGKRLGMPAARIVERLPKPLRSLTARPGLAARMITGILLVLLLLSLFSSQIPFVSAAPDVFYLRDTTTNGATPAGEDMNNILGSSENTLTFDSTDDEAYWYTDLTYPTGNDDATLAAGGYDLNMYFNQLPSSWWDTDYQYRQQITVSAGSANVPANYAVRIQFDHASLTTSKSLSSGDDVRIVYWNGSGWVELDRRLDDQSSWDASNTQIWFQTQAAINANNSDNNYYMYYGNSSASSPPASWSNIFLFYDDFNDASLDSGRWSCTRGTCTESGGTLTLSANSSVWASSSYALGVDTRWEARLQLSNADAIHYNYWGASDQDDYGGNYITYWTDDTQHVAEQNSSGSNISPSTPTSYHNYVFDREGTGGVRYTQDSTLMANITTNVPTGNLRTFIWVDASSRTETLDWVRVRDYVNPEPTSSFGSETEAPYVKIQVSVYHTRGDGSDATEIVTSSTTTIDANTNVPYTLPIGNGPEQTFTSSDPRRLRVHIDVTEVSGSGSFTLAYDAATNHSSLDTPALTVPDVTLLLLAIVYMIPVVTGIIMRKRRLALRIISVVGASVIVIALLSTQVVPASAEVTATTNTFWLYDDTTPQQYMMYQSQPSGSVTNTFFPTYFYSDDFYAGWQIGSGTATVYVNATNSAFFPGSISLRLQAGSPGNWTTLGTGFISVPWNTGIPTLVSGSISIPSGYTFSEGEQLELRLSPGSSSVRIYWDGSYNTSRLVTPTITAFEWGLLFIFLVPLFPAFFGVVWKRRRLAGQVISLLLAAAIALGLAAGDVGGVRAAPDTFYLHDTNTATTAITFDASSSNSASYTSSISWSHTIGSGSHRKLIVGVCIEENVLGDEPVTSVTYNSVPLTYANAVTAGVGYLQRVEVWYLDEAQLPSSGTYTIQVNTTGSVEEINAGAVSIAEAQSGAPETTATNTNFNSASITTNITTITNGAWVIDAIGGGNFGSYTPGVGQTERWDVSAFSATGAMSTKPVASAGLTSMQQIHSTMSTRNAHVLIAVAPYDPGMSPSGKYMNTTEGSAGSTMTFNSGGQDAYWYADEVWPTGNDDATIAAGDYTFNMYFNQLPAAPQVNLETFSVNFTSFDSTWVTVTKPTGTVEDDLLIAIMSHDSGFGTLGAPSGWTPIFDTLVSSFGCTFRAWYLIAGASEPAFYTFTSTDSDQLIAGIMRFSGHDLNDPIDVSNTSTGTSNAPTAPSVTTTVDDALVLRVFGTDDDYIFVDGGYPSGHTGIFVRGSGGFSDETSIGAAYMTQASQGSTGSAAFSMTWPEDWAAATIAIAPAVPEVDITVSAYHTKPDATNPQEIVTSSSTTIDAGTTDPYALDIGSALQQTFTSSDPQRLRLHVHVDSVRNGGSFTLDYDGTCASSRCSNLDTPVVTVPETAIAFLPAVVGIPGGIRLIQRRRRRRSQKGKGRQHG